MKIAAILVPVALFLIWSFAGMAISASNTKRSKGEENTRPIPRKDSKRLVIIYVLIFLIFSISVAWSAYVFTGRIWLSVLFFLIWSLPVPIAIFLARLKMPKPPPGGWPDEKARLDAFAKWRDERQKRTDAEQEQRYKETESIVLGLFSKRGRLFCVRLIAWLILIPFGVLMIVCAVGDMSSPPSDFPLAANIAIMIFAGILPLAGGIALCVFDVKKWRKPKAK